MKTRLCAVILCLGACVSSLSAGSVRERESALKDGMSFISEDKVWEYVWTDYPEGIFLVLYHMKFDGSVEVNGHTYSRFINYEAIKYADGLGSEGVMLPDAELYAPSYYREDGETVYMLMKDGGPAVGEIADSSGYSESVMMDFSLQDGNVFPKGCFVEDDEVGSLYVCYVGSDNTVPDPARRYFGLYSVCEDGSESMYKPVFGEGLGLTTGILPCIELYWTTSMYQSFLLRVMQGRDTIYKNHVYDNLWNWGPDSVESVGSILPEPEMRNGMVCLEGEVVTIFDVAGYKVAEGMNEVCVTQLPHGMYMVRAGASTLKILVK